MILTRDWLIAHGSSYCRMLDTFEENWPEGMEITEANLRRGMEVGLSLHWFALRVLPRESMQEHRQISIDLHRKHDDGNTVAIKRDDALIEMVVAHCEELP